VTEFLYTHKSLYGGLTEFVPHLLYSTGNCNKIIRRINDGYDDDDEENRYGYFGYGLGYVNENSNKLVNEIGKHFFITGFKNEHMSYLQKIDCGSNKIPSVTACQQDFSDILNI
jgi:hypothetical protein